MTGALYLVPNLLGAVPPARALPQHTIDIARRLAHWVVETPKPARAFMKSLEMAAPIAALDIRTFPATPAATDIAALLAPARDGDDVGVLTDAGCPGVADPGAKLVAAAHEAGIRVVPLVGPSAILLALMASGMNGQRFLFHGYLPAKTEARANALRSLEADSHTKRRAELFIETPYRNVAMLETIAQTLKPATTVCIAADLTLDTESIERRSVAAWRGYDVSRFAKRPALFVVEA
ncbi:MAG TPA: SAM-dependent methyltransferase [Casimicrobiaceae bacterium]|jgi:16S rRNA (cytidine1402-2'-O)-methyltransferase